MSDVDKAFQNRIDQALRKHLINLGIYEKYDEHLIEIYAGNAMIFRKARQELAALQQSNDAEAVKVVEEIVQEQRELNLKSLEYFCIDPEKHKDLAEMLGK